MKWQTVGLAGVVVSVGMFGVYPLLSTTRLPTSPEALTVVLASGAPTDTLDLTVTWTPSTIAGDSIMGYRVLFWIDGVSDSMFIGSSTATSWVFRAPPAPQGSIAEYRLGVQAVSYGGIQSELSHYMLRRQGPGVLTAATTLQPELHIQLKPRQFIADSFGVVLETYPDGGTVSTGKQTIGMMRSIADSIIITPSLRRGDRHAFFLVPYMFDMALAGTIHIAQLNFSRQ